MTGLTGYMMDVTRFAGLEAMSQRNNQFNSRAPSPDDFSFRRDDARLGNGQVGQEMSHYGAVAQLTGAVISSIGAWGQANAQREQARAAASYAEHQQRMADINARQAELDAQDILAAGRQQSFLQTMRAGQARSQRRARTAARGVELGSGSAAELLASEDIAREIDRSVVKTNTVRAANQARTRATNLRNQSLLQGVSARNLRSSADSISPELAAFSSATASAGRFAQTFNLRNLRRPAI